MRALSIHGKCLLAEASADVLREDARRVSEFVKDGITLGRVYTPGDDEALLRLAALAEAVAVMEGRQSGWFGQPRATRWNAETHGELRWMTCIPGSTDVPQTMCAALSTLLPTEDTTDE